MLKKMTLLAMALAAVTAMAAPSMASAATEWTKNGATMVANDKVHLEGTYSFSSPVLGTINCTKEVTAEIELTAGTHDGHLLSLKANSPTTNCDVGGFIGSTCGTKSLETLELTGKPSITGTAHTKVWHISGITLHTKFGAGGSCLQTILTGGLTVTVDNENGFTEATLSGSLAASGGFGNVTVSGVLKPTAAQSGVYGIKTFNTP